MSQPDGLRGVGDLVGFRNYRDFLAREGLPGLISSHGLSVETEKVVSAGNMHVYVARK
jgi:hypothetical protein